MLLASNDSPYHPNPRALGQQLLTAARSSTGDFEDVLKRIALLPKSEAAELADVAVELCGVYEGQGNASVALSSRLAGACLTLQCGLAFNWKVVNDELVPALTREPLTQCDIHIHEETLLRRVRVRALSHLAPHIDDAGIDDALQSVLAQSNVGGRCRSNLCLPFSNFEASFRSDTVTYDVKLRSTARSLGIRSIADMLDATVAQLAEATPETLPSVLSRLSVSVRLASISLLSIAPSLTLESGVSMATQPDRIAEAMEWLLKRPFGFPGPSSSTKDRKCFESVRSFLSLAYGVLVVHEPEWRARFEELTLPNPAGHHFLGTALLGSMKRQGVEDAVEWGRDIAASQLQEVSEPTKDTSQSLIEAIALSWHLGVSEVVCLDRVMEFICDPIAQFFCARALNDNDPWRRF